MKKVIGAQGEVTIIKIDAVPEGIESVPVEMSANGFIVSHSESGHHHLLTGGNVIERTSNVPQGMKILYGVLARAEDFIHAAPNSHGGYKLEPGIYEFRISREYNPFSEQARTVKD